MIFAIVIVVILPVAAAYFLAVYRAFSKEPKNESRYNLKGKE